MNVSIVKLTVGIADAARIEFAAFNTDNDEHIVSWDECDPIPEVVTQAYENGSAVCV